MSATTLGSILADLPAAPWLALATLVLLVAGMLLIHRAHARRNGIHDVEGRHAFRARSRETRRG